MPLDISVAAYRLRHPSDEDRVKKTDVAHEGDYEHDRQRRIRELTDYGSMMTALGKPHLAAKAEAALARLRAVTPKGGREGHAYDSYTLAMRRAAKAKGRAGDG